MQVQNVSNKQITNKARTGKKREYVSSEHNDRKVKVASLVGSATGIAIILGGILTKNHKKMLNETAAEAQKLGVAVETLLKEKAAKSAGKIKPLPLDKPEDLLKLAAGSILGGLTGGLLTDKKENAKPKVRESLQQFFGNITIPVSILALNMHLLDKSKFSMPLLKATRKYANKLNPVIKEVPRIGITIASLFGGLALGNKVMNKVNDKIFKGKENREVKPSDFSAHADDLCFASSFIFKDGSAIKGVISRILPATFLVAGYEAGTHKAQEN